MSDTDPLSSLLAERPEEDPGGPSWSGEIPEAKPQSPTVLSLDRWSRRRGEAAREEWIDLGAGDHDELVAADALGALYEPVPVLAENPADPRRAAWWAELMGTSDYRRLHSETCLRGDLSRLAGAEIAKSWAEYAAKNVPETQPGADDEPIEKQLSRVRSVTSALQAAEDAAQSMKDLGDACGYGQGSPGDALDRKTLAGYMRRLRNDAQLRAILRWAGRMRRVAESRQRAKTHAHTGTVSGIELSGDLARLLPLELAQVAGVVEELEMLALHRLATRRSLSYRLSAPKPENAGPIVVVVDESGSMSGEPIAAAKGLALALAWVARHQKRWCALVGFSGGTTGNMLVVDPGQRRDEALLEWCEHFYAGGTNLDVPLGQLPFKYWPALMQQGLPRGKTDVIIVTDAEVEDSQVDEYGPPYLEWAKRESVSTYTIVMGQKDAGPLSGISTRTWAVEDLSPDGAAVGCVLSI